MVGVRALGRCGEVASPFCEIRTSTYLIYVLNGHLDPTVDVMGFCARILTYPSRQSCVQATFNTDLTRGERDLDRADNEHQGSVGPKGLDHPM